MARKSGLRSVLAAASFLAGLAGSEWAAWSAEPAELAPHSAPAANASLSHSAAKATTFKIGTIVTNLAIFSAGTGSLVGGTLLTAFNVSKSWALFAGNDYAWDTWFPSEANQDGNKNFNVKDSFWRTTGKFLTYKPVDTAIKFASIYLYTGSAGVMLVYGTASSVLNTGVFYANDLGWDLYDWWRLPVVPEEPAQMAEPRARADRITAPIRAAQGTPD